VIGTYDHDNDHLDYVNRSQGFTRQYGFYQILIRNLVVFILVQQICYEYLTYACLMCRRLVHDKLKLITLFNRVLNSYCFMCSLPQGCVYQAVA
jgi:hypothetical protein